MDDRDPRIDRWEVPTAATADAAATPVEKQQVFAGTGLFWSLILGILLATGILIFIAQNTATVSVNWLWLHFSVPLVVLLLATALIAVVLDEIVGVLLRRRRRRRLTERGELDRLRARR